MPGSFLPPVVTELTGDIGDLAAKIEQAKALIKSLGNTDITIKFNVDNASLARAVAQAKTVSGSIDGVTNSVNRLADAGRRGGVFGAALPVFGAMTPNQLHATALGIAEIGAAIAGTAVAAGSLGAVWANGAANSYKQLSGLATSTLATIPPGVPDYALAKTFGLNNLGPNSPLARASAVGNNQVLSGIGGLIALANKNTGVGSLVANQGINTGAGLDNLIAKMDLASSHSKALSRFMQNTTTDAANLAAGFGNIGSFLGHAATHMPGELEWISTAFRNTTGWANDALKNPVSGNILGSAIFGGLLMHGTTSLAQLGAGALSKLPLSKIPGVSEGAATSLSNFSKLKYFSSTAAGGPLLLNPVALGAAAAVGSGLAVYRYQNPTSAAIRGISSDLYNTTAGQFSQNIAGSMGLFAHGAATGSQDQSLIGWAMHLAGPMSLAGELSPSKWLSPSQQNANALWNAQQSFFAYGSGVNAVAKSLGVSTSTAAQLMSQSGVKINAKGQIEGGNPQAVRLAQNFLNGNRIVNGSTGQAMANIAVGNVVNDSAWKAAGTISGNWDTFMGGLTGGGIGLGNMYSALQNLSPSAARNLAVPTGIIPTSQAISSAAQPLTDFFRQAQSTGAIGGKSLSNSILQTAASLGPLAGNSKAAQAELVALARESGVNVKSFQQLMNMTGGAAQAQKDMANSIAGTTTKMAQVPALAQKVNQDVTQNLTGMVAAIVSKNKTAGNAFNFLTTQMAKFGDSSPQAQKAAQGLEKDLENQGMSAYAAANFIKQLGVTWTNLKFPPKNALVTIDTITNGASMPSNAQILSGKMTFGAGQKKAGGYAVGTPAAPPGWAWVGERGPELERFTGGEVVIPHNVAKGYASGVGGVPAINLTVELDGRQISSRVKSATYQYNVNNGNRDPQGRVSGNWSPRG